MAWFHNLQTWESVACRKKKRGQSLAFDDWHPLVRVSRASMSAQAQIDSLCTSLLQRVNGGNEDEASLTSVSRSRLTNSTLLKIATPSSEKASEVVRQLREAFPLFSVCSVECLLTGNTATSILVPNKDEQTQLARSYARKLPMAQFLLGVQITLGVISICTFVVVAWTRFALL